MGRAERCISETTNTDYQREDCRVPAWLHSERSLRTWSWVLTGCVAAHSLIRDWRSKTRCKTVDREEYWFEAVLFILILAVCVLYPVCTKAIFDLFRRQHHVRHHFQAHIDLHLSRIHPVQFVFAQTVVVVALSWPKCTCKADTGTKILLVYSLQVGKPSTSRHFPGRMQARLKYTRLIDKPTKTSKCSPHLYLIKRANAAPTTTSSPFWNSAHYISRSNCFSHSHWPTNPVPHHTTLQPPSKSSTTYPPPNQAPYSAPN